MAGWFPRQALAAPFRVVLTESKARQYFGLSDATKAVGRQIRYDDSLAVTVSGIVKDLHQPTDFIFTDFISYSTIGHSWLKNSIPLDDWSSTNGASQFFVKRNSGSSTQPLEATLKRAAKAYMAKNHDADWKIAFRLQPLSNLHFNTELRSFDNASPPANLTTLRLLSGVALLLLLIAVINFVNLITAQASRRAKEVGVRKVLGGTRRELVTQFLSETLLLTACAVLLSLLLADGALRYFQEFIPVGVALHPSDPFTLLFLLTTLLVAGLLSGAYPALVLSSFAPVLALKNLAYASASQSRTALLRKGLIVFQFSFAQVLILGTFVVGRQMDYMQHKEMGFDREAIVSFRVPWRSANQALKGVLKQELAQLPGVAAISLHETPPASSGYSSSIIVYDDGKEVHKLDVYRKFGDTAFIHLFNIPLVAGRNLHASDTAREFLINETYARQLGFQQPGQALGKTLRYNNRQLPIVGVVRDFHLQSLHNVIQPVAIASQPSDFYTFSLKLATQGKGATDLKATMEQVGQRWKQVYPQTPFTYAFLDDSIARFYEAEQRTSKLAVTATAIAVLISCLGLFGLATYTAEMRTKEIGIRKVLGATVANIVSLLSQEFVKLVLLANLIAWPLAWYVMHEWLQDFTYHISIGWWVFAAAGSLALLIALLTISYQAVKAALSNPVESLRTE